jgi:hypothetical protein
MATPPSSGITFSGGIQISGGFTADGPAVADPYWQYVSYLSQSAEANAAQNNTFLDSSTNNLSITRNGSTTQGSASPFSPDWSNYFNGSTAYLSAASNAAFTFGTGDFTVEAWVYRTASGNAGVFSNGPASSGSFAFYIIANKLQVDFYGGTSLTGATTLANNTWYHIAATRSGTTLRIFLNGVIDASTTSSSNNTSSNCVVGLDWTNSTTYFPGYISNLRVVKGTAVYTANFTPSTNPLFVISGTSILTCQSPAFLDNSINNFALTATGSPSVQRFSPFANFVQTPNTYSTKFDGNNDYISVPSSANNAFGTGDFTIECWAYSSGVNPVDANNTKNIIDYRTAEPSTQVTLYYGGLTDSFKIAYYVNGVSVILSTNAEPENSWNHIALVRSSGVTKLYLNGTQTGSSYTDTNNFTATSCNIGGRFAATGGDYRSWNGYLSNVRVVKGTAVYTSNFTPPTSPLTAIANTSILTCQNATIIDNSTNAFTLTAAGTPTPKQYNPLGYTLSSIQTYDATTYGGSMYFNGTTDYLTATSNAAFAFGTGNFTIEAWVNVTNYSGTCAVFDTRTAGNEATGVIFYITATGMLSIYNSAALVTASTALSTTTWNHVAVTRSGTTVNLWLNGVSVGSGTVSTNFSQQNSYIGAAYTGSANMMLGYISNLRVVKGTALYTSNFVPSLTPLSAVTNTSLLLSGTNAGIYDASMINNQITVGDAQSSTSVVKYGSTSMKFDGTGDYLSVVPNVTSSFGTGDFTIESWIYLTSGSTYQFLLGSSDNASGYMMIGLNVPLSPTSTIAIGRSGINWPVQFGAGTTLTSNTWYHIAITRSGTTNRAFINGTQLGSNVTDSTSWSFPSNAMWIGNQTGGTALNGYLSDFRITKGVARYTSNFTPPTTALPTSGPGPTATSTVEYLLVGGGGGGGNNGGGGGGGGAYRTATGFAVAQGVALTVTIGAGGTSAVSNLPGNVGGDTTFSSLTANGGGGGGGENQRAASYSGNGSGGGGQGNSGGTGAAGGTYGNAGANGYGGAPYRAGGGGGASSAGTAGTSTGNGGAGTSSSITGSLITYAGGGGGGGGDTTPGSGGTGGGGNGGSGAGGSNSVAGTTNTGGGGGGSAGSGGLGASGGSGIVIIRYPDNFAPASSTTGSPTVTVAGGYRVYKYTASGSITF